MSWIMFIEPELLTLKVGLLNAFSNPILDDKVKKGCELKVCMPVPDLAISKP